MTGSPRLAYRPDLDGLRGLAILLVLVEHTAIAGGRYALPFTPAMAGVTTFFVLSGYLITGLLLREQRIDLRNFYLRRVARLGPALVVVVAAVAVIGTATGSLWLPGFVTTLLYITNWAHIFGIDPGLLQHTWSLAIEEQFYLLWPITMILVPRRFLLPVAAGLAIAGCALYASGDETRFWSTFTNGGALMAGCAAAIAGNRLPRLAGLLGVALIGVGGIFWSQAAAVVGSVLVVSAPIDALLPLGPLGRRAYSIYLWSWPLVVLVGGILALPLTLAAAELSYRIVERPILARYHERLRPRSALPSRTAESSA